MTRRQTRLATLAVVITGITLSLFLSLSALQKNVTFFYSPSDLIGSTARYDIPEGSFRLGGVVAYGSVSHYSGKLRFTVTDHKQTLPVLYYGLPPDLFREGQGVVATGKMENAQEGYVFHAQELLAKHDENYMPPEVKRALEREDIK